MIKNRFWLVTIGVLISHIAFAQEDPVEQGLAYYEQGQYELAHDALVGPAEKGHWLAQHLMGFLHYHERIEQASESEAQKWLHQSYQSLKLTVEEEQAGGMELYHLGVAYLYGIWGAEEDHDRTCGYFRQAANLDYDDAVAQLAHHCANSE